MEFENEESCPFLLVPQAAHLPFVNNMRKGKTRLTKNALLKNAKNNKTKEKQPIINSLSNLPDDIMLIILHDCSYEVIEKTREFQSEWVQHCTMNVEMAKAVKQQNLDNMKWIRGRRGLHISPSEYSNYYYNSIRAGNLSIMKWFHKIGIPWGKAFFFYAVGRGNLVNLKWLYDNGCPWGTDAFNRGADYGKLENMKWLYEKGCPWTKHTFAAAARYGSIENMKWLKKVKCPWGFHTMLDAARYGSLDNLEWLKKKRCPWGTTTMVQARETIYGVSANHANVLVWMQANGCPEC